MVAQPDPSPAVAPSATTMGSKRDVPEGADSLARSASVKSTRISDETVEMLDNMFGTTLDPIVEDEEAAGEGAPSTGPPAEVRPIVRQPKAKARPSHSQFGAGLAGYFLAPTVTQPHTEVGARRPAGQMAHMGQTEDSWPFWSKNGDVVVASFTPSEANTKGVLLDWTAAEALRKKLSGGTVPVVKPAAFVVQPIYVVGGDDFQAGTDSLASRGECEIVCCLCVADINRQAEGRWSY